MSEYARIEGGKVAATLDLPDALYASWKQTGNPKAVAYRPVITDTLGPYDPAREAPVESFVVQPTQVRRVWSIRAKTPDELRQVWTPLDFLGRFTTAEMAQVETAREHDEIVRSFYRAALAAQEIVSDDPRTVAGVNYLSAIGILTLGRVDEVLGR